MIHLDFLCFLAKVGFMKLFPRSLIAKLKRSGMGMTTDPSAPGLDLRTERDSVSVVDESVCLCRNCEVVGGIQEQSALFIPVPPL